MTDIPYSWYRDRWFQTNVDDAGNGSTPLSEADWNKLTQQQRFQHIGVNSYGPSDNDPLMQQIAQQYRAAGFQGNPTLVSNFTDDGAFKNPSGVYTDPNTGARFTQPDNIANHRGWLNPMTGIGLVLGGGLLNNFLTSGSLLGGGGSAGFVPSDYGMAEGYAFGAPEAAGGGAGAGSSYAFQNAQPIPNITPTTLPNLAANPQAGLLSSLFSDPMGTMQNAGSSLLSSAIKNPIGALGLLQAAGGAIGGRGGGGGGGSSYTPQNLKGGGGAAAKAPQQQFYVNPYTLAQLARYGGGR